MRNIGLQWRNLADGLSRVEALETRFRGHWGPRLEGARSARHEADLRRARRRGRAALATALVLTVLLLIAALALQLISSPAWGVFVALAIVTPVMVVPYSLWSLLRTPKPPPDPSNLTGRWWRTISVPATSTQRSGPAFSAQRYGDEGEAAFVSYLARRLSEEYLAIRGPLVAPNLDADVIVAGPTGVCVYEVKNWSGQITCERGEWRRVKSYRQPGGRLVREVEFLRPFDRQWAKEADSVREVFRREMADHPDLPGAIGGGLVFTHAGLSFVADDSCRCWYGRPASCVEVLGRSPEMPGFTMERRLGAVDALLGWSDRLHERQGGASWERKDAVELAERLYVDAVSNASTYVSEVSDEPVRVADNGKTEEPRKRAVWIPHPDDPPKDT